MYFHSFLKLDLVPLDKVIKKDQPLIIILQHDKGCYGSNTYEVCTFFFLKICLVIDINSENGWWQINWKHPKYQIEMFFDLPKFSQLYFEVLLSKKNYYPGIFSIHMFKLDIQTSCSIFQWVVTVLTKVSSYPFEIRFYIRNNHVGYSYFSRSLVFMKQISWLQFVEGN